MADVYMYQAALWCEDCIRERLINDLGGDAALATLSDDERDAVWTSNLLRSVLIADGRDPDNESTWDSDEFPKGPYPDGGGEADMPQHCAGCDVFLENPLTTDGYEYVLAAIQDRGADSHNFSERI